MICSYCLQRNDPNGFGCDPCNEYVTGLEFGSHADQEYAKHLVYLANIRAEVRRAGSIRLFIKACHDRLERAFPTISTDYSRRRRDEMFIRQGESLRTIGGPLNDHEMSRDGVWERSW